MADKTQSLTNGDIAELAKHFIKCHGDELWKELKPNIEVNPKFEKYAKDILLMGVELGVAETLKMMRDATDET